jgi:hypothetical protein
MRKLVPRARARDHEPWKLPEPSRRLKRRRGAMRHARDEDLDRLEDLLADLRALPGLREKKRGVFYFKSRAFLHFHEDPKGLFADIGGGPSGGPLERLDVTEAAGRRALLRLAAERLA